MIDKRCQAGRLADYGGRWVTPCPKDAEEALAFSEEVKLPRVSGTPVLLLCNAHMEQLILDGMIDEPFVDTEEWIARLEPELPGAALARMIDEIEKGDPP